jgi:hypothetical protein
MMGLVRAFEARPRAPVPDAPLERAPAGEPAEVARAHDLARKRPEAVDSVKFLLARLARRDEQRDALARRAETKRDRPAQQRLHGLLDMRAARSEEAFEARSFAPADWIRQIQRDASSRRNRDPAADTANNTKRIADLLDTKVKDGNKILAVAQGLED